MQGLAFCRKVPGKGWFTCKFQRCSPVWLFVCYLDLKLKKNQKLEILPLIIRQWRNKTRHTIPYYFLYRPPTRRRFKGRSGNKIVVGTLAKEKLGDLEEETREEFSRRLRNELTRWKEWLVRRVTCCGLNMGSRRSWDRNKSQSWKKRGSPRINNMKWFQYLKYLLIQLTLTRGSIMGSMCQYSLNGRCYWCNIESDRERVSSWWGGYGGYSYWRGKE